MTDVSCNVNAGGYLYCCCYLDLWNFQKVMKSGAILEKVKVKSPYFTSLAQNSPGGGRLMECAAGLGRIFTPILIDYNGVTCSLKLLAWDGTFSILILGMKKFR